MDPPKKLSNLPSTADDGNGRVHSLYTSPVLQTSPHPNMEVIRVPGSEYSSVPSSIQQHSTDTRKDKNKEKEGAGHRLLNMLRKTLKGSDSKVGVEVIPEVPTLVPFGDVVGCLAVHVKNCKHFIPTFNLQHYNNLFIRVSINNIVKFTKIRVIPNNEKNIIVKFNEVKYFSIQVPRRPDDERNNIYLELMHSDNIEKTPVFLGSVHVHLYEVIQKGSFTEELQMFSKNTFVCRVEVEFMFSYGNFGYGYSHQLKPLQKMIDRSMFLNIAPPPERTDPEANVIMPRPIEYPALLSPDLNVTVGMPPDTSTLNQPSLIQLDKLQQPRERLEKMKKEYRNLGTWKEKVNYLERVLTPKLEHKESKENTTSEELDKVSDVILEDTATSGVSVLEEEAKTVPHKLSDNNDNKDQTPPTLSQSPEKNSEALAPESTKKADTPPTTAPPATPTGAVIKENKTPAKEDQSKAEPDGKTDEVVPPPPPEERMQPSAPSIMKRDSSPSEVTSECLTEQSLNRPCSLEEVMQSKSNAHKNANVKGKSVAFLPQEYYPPYFRSKYTEFRPRYQKFNTKDGFDPLLRNINNKMSARKRKDQDIFKCRESLSAEVIEHEDQDPPYRTPSKTARPTNLVLIRTPDSITIKALDNKGNLMSKLSGGPDIAPVKTPDSKSKLDGGPGIIPIKTLDTKSKLDEGPESTTEKTIDIENKLKERTPDIYSPNFEGDSSVIGKANSYCLANSLILPASIETLKSFKTIFDKNLENLVDKILSKGEVHMDGSEARDERPTSPLLYVSSEPTSSLQAQLLENSQDLKSWVLESDTSKSLLSHIIKDVATESLAESEAGISPEVERELTTGKHFKTGEVDFPVKKKSSFKKKHLQSEESVSKPVLNGFASDYNIKQIFTAPYFSKISMKELSETQRNLQNQLPTSWESLPSSILLHYKEKEETELPQAKSVISQLLQSFPIDTLIESGVIKVVELDKEHQKNILPDIEIAFADNNLKRSTEDYSKSFQEQEIPIMYKEAIPFNSVEFISKGQTMSPKDSTYQSTPNKKADLPSNGQRLDRKENDLSSTLENLSNLLMGNLHESDIITLNSLLKNILNAFFKYNQAERRAPEKELEKLINHSFLNNIEHLEAARKQFDKTDDADRKPILNPKLSAFLEELSESEIKHFKSELSKHIQHYLVERLSESGHITKEDLPKIYQNLYLMNKKTELEGQNIFLEKYSKTVKEIMSFVNNFNHHFIDKHLEIKLRSFLTEILQNYFLKNLSDSNLFKETEPDTVRSNMSSLRTKSVPISFHELEQDISRGSFGRRLDINMKYPLNKSLQNCLIALSRNELLNIKANLRTLLQGIFIGKLAQSGLITESQLEKINRQINSMNSGSKPIKSIKAGFSFGDEHQFMEEHSKKQNKFSGIVQEPKDSEDRFSETDRKEEKGYFPLHDIKENLSVIKEQKRYHPTEGAKTLNIVKVQPVPNKNIQMVPLNKSPESLTDTMLRKQREEIGFLPLPRAENTVLKTEIQNPQNWSGNSQITDPNTCFERTLKTKFFEKKEHNNSYKLMLQEKHETLLLPHPRIPNYKMLNKEYVDKLTFLPRQGNSLTHFNSEAGRVEDQYCQRLKGNNNNNKKQHFVTFSQYKNEIQTLYTSPNEICNEKYATVPELQPFKYKAVESEKSSKSSLFPEVFKRENVKPKVRKERDHASRQKKSLNRMARILPATLSSPRSLLRKSVPKTLLHWTARRTVHDCSDRFEDLPMTSFQHLENAKSRARLLGKSTDDRHHQLKHFARPYTAPEVNKRRESYTGKYTSLRMVSAGLAHTNDTIPSYQIHKL
ncbi:PREDICTED: amyotrophic lateral sclerosis 2 chromosomal region candidate gene 11 protein [Condylura cristata]|uniref:amyotrophic lateral sclerosis 2 chromosomal region candidate gene 11 protein n=1 Tax=Condylura cristata TaxID=143302 RepID=UPI000642FDF3|nr:PREDICTED: amyotrophic lateral sclerosis 2 chromosomal region candidate gene 11 protein [Condylura cristata]